MSNQKLAIVAFGGNALIEDDARCSILDQSATVEKNVTYIVDLVEAGWRVLLTHGNGPQVGFILRRSDLAACEVAPVPVDYAVGDTQGAIGYMFQRALTNELRRRGLSTPVIALVTQTLVDENDPAFDTPCKPIGGFMDESTAKANEDKYGWTVVEDSGRGWRRAVPSPKPKDIVELDVIEKLLDTGALVIAGGGGGIPVCETTEGQLQGLEAVVDKDLTTALLASKLNADAFIIPTGVEKVAINFGRPDQQWLDTLSVDEAARLSEEGQFGEGSMKPKVEALLSYVRNHDSAIGIITSPQSLAKALAGDTGTRIVK